MGEAGHATGHRAWHRACVGDPVRLRPLVLLAEDDADFRDLLRSRLMREGFDVLEARNGDEALALGAAPPAGERLAVLVLDVRMPGVSGLDVVRELRSQGQQTPCVLVTAFPDSKLHALVARLPHTTLLAKPFESHDFHLAVLALYRRPASGAGHPGA